MSAAVECFGTQIPLDEYLLLVKEAVGFPEDPHREQNRAFAAFHKLTGDARQAEIMAVTFLHFFDIFGKPTAAHFSEWWKARHAPYSAVSEDNRIAILQAFAAAKTAKDFEAVDNAVTLLPGKPDADLQAIQRLSWMVVNEPFNGEFTREAVKEIQQRAAAIKPRPQLPLVVGRCAQMLHWAHNGGADANYEQWRGTLSVIKFCAPFAGGDAVELLCGGHPGYSHDACFAKMEDISAPFRCETIGSDEHCGRCKYQGAIASPIGLGFSREPNVARRKGVAA